MTVILHNAGIPHHLCGCVFPNASVSKGQKPCWKPPITLKHGEALLKWEREAQSANLLSSAMQTAFTDYYRALHLRGHEVTLVCKITSIIRQSIYKCGKTKNTVSLQEQANKHTEGALAAIELSVHCEEGLTMSTTNNLQ